jgi:hypothetical protein
VFGPPRFNERLLPVHFGNLPPVGKNAPRPLADVCREAEQPATQFDRRPRGRLANLTTSPIVQDKIG